ncbi:MAG TPA: hypothetical protein VEX36_06905 [Thermoleophilaceae bacterium]|nr:hypothetical protein [Thermoleophilaceae bacterium]
MCPQPMSPIFTPVLNHEIAGIQQRLERQLGAIEAGVDPALVGRRITALKGELQDAETALAQLDLQERAHGTVNVGDACEILDAVPDLGKKLATADPELRRNVYDAFRLSVEIDRNQGQITLKVLVSSAFTKTSDLTDLVAPIRP